MDDEHDAIALLRGCRQRSTEPLPDCGAPPPYRLQLLGGFQLFQSGAAVDLLPSGQRLLAYLGVTHRAPLRTHVASALWMDTSEQRAMANLRSVIWRVNRTVPGLLSATGAALRLVPECEVDAQESAARWLDVLAGKEIEPYALLEPGAAELLPGWSEEWVLAEQDRIRQLRLHALEQMSQRHLSEGEPEWAVELALAVVVEDPLRESANRCLIRAHLEQGNYVDAFRRYDVYRSQLHEHLGLPPSPQMEDLMAAVPVQSRRLAGRR